MARLSDRVVTGAPNGILSNDEPIQWYAADGITLIDGIKVDPAGAVYLAPAGGPTEVGGDLDVTGTATIKDGINSVFIEGRTDGSAIGANISVIDGVYAANPIAGSRIALAHAGAAGQRGGITFASKNTDDDSIQPTVQGVLTPAGDWGFGTTTPQYKVEVAGTLGVTGDVSLPVASKYILDSDAASDSYLWASANDTVELWAGAKALTAIGNNVTGHGNLDVATDLGVTGSTNLGGPSAAGARLNIENGGSLAIQVRSGGSIQMRPTANDFDWRFKQEGSSLNFYQGANLVTPVVEMKMAGVDIAGDLDVTGVVEANWIKSVTTAWPGSPAAGEARLIGLAADGCVISGSGSGHDVLVTNKNGAHVLKVPTGTTNVEIVGALSKGSGSFRIDHPLKPDTHQLVHSFTESPQADLLYSGSSDLVDGAAEINLDEFHGMTEGTFVALNRNIRVFTTNETDWEPIRGSVSGNILTISCRDDACTDKVSWLVIGERQDDHMMDTDWTDEQGRVIVEPLKPEVLEENV